MNYERFLFPLFFLAIIISLYSEIKVTSTFKKYSKVRTRSGMNAAEFARFMLDGNGLSYVRIERVRGSLTDHYDPKSETLRLSDPVYASESAAAIGVAAHEAGHAIQHSVGYLPIKIRSMLVPITSFASRVSWILIMLGVIIGFFGELFDFGYMITMSGIALFSLTALFQLVTLPCEFNASRRAMNAIRACGRYSDEELSASKKVLGAAALTYVAALFVSVIQILRLLLIFGRGRRR